VKSYSENSLDQLNKQKVYDKNVLIRPVLRWAGSKRQIIHRLIPFWNSSFKRYVEPFAGSATLFFAINPSKALLSDLNQELIEVYEVLRKHPKKLHYHVNLIPKNKRAYIRLRGIKPGNLSKFKRAVRFTYLNRLCFNGIFRTNMKGEFNVPYASTGTGLIPSVEHFRRCAKSLNNAKICSCDFGNTLSKVKEGDFVYIDPPYAVEDRRVFCEYGPNAFNKADLKRLFKYLKIIDLKGASFLMSYADCKEARAIFKNWEPKRIKVRRNIAGFSSQRKHAYELLITNIDNKKRRFR